MKTFTIVCGVYGVGKSTFTGALTGFTDANIPIVNQNQQEALMYLEEGSSVIQETTLSDPTTYNNVLFALNAGYRVNLFYFAISSAEESIIRIKNRVEKGGHFIDEETIRERFAHRFDELVRIMPLCHNAVIYDNENGFVPVATFENGKLIKISELTPVWYEELCNKNEQYRLSNYNNEGSQTVNG